MYGRRAAASASTREGPPPALSGVTIDDRSIVAETFAPGANVPEIARRHGLNRGLLFSWRWQGRRARPSPVAEAASEEAQDPVFVPVEIEGKFRQTLLDIYVPRYGLDWGEEFLDSGPVYARIEAARMFTFAFDGAD